MDYPGFIGLGVMGEPMAQNLISAGYKLPVFDIVPERMHYLTLRGATPCHSARAVAESCSILFLMVRDQREIDTALFGEQGATAGMRSGGIVVIMSSISAPAALRVARRLHEHGVSLLDAPVSGGREGAKAATLAIMAGSEPEVFERVAPFLRSMGKNITHVGGVGSGQVAKAANQLIVAVTRAAIGEAIRMVVAEGIPAERVLPALEGGAADCASLRSYAPRMVAAEDPVEFGSPIIAKDMASLRARIQELNLEMPFSELVGRMYLEYGQKPPPGRD